MSKIFQSQADKHLILAKLLSIKDNLANQLYLAVLYKKQILWSCLDLHKQSRDGEPTYASPKVVQIFKIMQNYEDDFGYTPPTMFFESERVL
jgi:hypothetical protein